jgi:transposase
VDSEALSNFKQRIERENINNQGPKRRFSKKLKKDIVQFLKKTNMSSHAAAKALSLSYSSVERWKATHGREFNPVSVTAPIVKRKSKKNNESKIIRRNQIVLIVLVTAQLVERLIQYLAS